MHSPSAGIATNILPEKLGRYVDHIVRQTDADPIMITISALCMVSAFVKHRRFIPKAGDTIGNVGYFQDLYPNFWTLCISQSGSFKTTALHKGFNLAIEHDRNIKDSMEGRVLLPNRTTTEGLLDDLAGPSANDPSNYHRGGAIICSEFGAWLDTLERTYNQGLKPLLTDLYDVPKIYSYKTKKDGLKSLNEPFITICGVSTIEWVKDNIAVNDVSSGFFARFLIFYPPQHEKTPPALPINGLSTDTQSEKDVKRILEGIRSEKIAYRLDDQARKKFMSYHDGLYDNFKTYPESAQQIVFPYLKRWSPYVLKIAMLLQIFIDENSGEICADAISGACAIVDQAIHSTLWLFENELGESEHQRKVRKVRNYITKKGGNVKWQTLIGSRVLDGGVKDYEYVLQTLEGAGEVQVTDAKLKRDKLITFQEGSNDSC